MAKIIVELFDDGVARRAPDLVGGGDGTAWRSLCERALAYYFGSPTRDEIEAAAIRAGEIIDEKAATGYYDALLGGRVQ